MSYGVATWKRPVIWALGEDGENVEILQWTAAVAVALIVAIIVGDFTAHAIWPTEWVITRQWELPVGLSRDFVLIRQSTIDAIAMDPLVFDESEGEDRYWRMAHGQEHYLFIVERVDEVGIQFLAGRPPIAWEEHLFPFSAGDWRGKFSPAGAGVAVNREDWALDIKYQFNPSPLLWTLLFVEGIPVFSFIFLVYRFLVRPLHLKLADFLKYG